MSVNITANSFSGKYGFDMDIGDIIHIKVEVEKIEAQALNKEILFLVDTSSSMHASMKEVKSSILAFRDSLIGKSPLDMEDLSKENRDQLFRSVITTRLIVFSNDAKEVWNSKDSSEFFEDAVLNLRSEALTNMGDALKLAFKKVESNKFSWIIVMTDGESNRGPCRTQDSFQRLVTSEKPLNSKIVSLGYGNKFDPEVLNVLGTFAYVENSEVIPVVLGNLAEEIMTSVGFNCVVDLPKAKLPMEVTEDTIIDPNGENNLIPCKIIAGDRVIGPLCSGKIYDIIYLPHGNNQSVSQIEEYRNVYVRYTDISSREEKNLVADILHTNTEPNSKHRELYFEKETKDMIYSLYKAIQIDTRSLEKVIKHIEKRLETWNDQNAEMHKEELRKLIKDSRRDHGTSNHRASVFLNRAVGSGYTNIDDPTEGYGYASVTLSSTRYYMESPLVNNK
jgi:uncharacterized protein YegL